MSQSPSPNPTTSSDPDFDAAAERVTGAGSEPAVPLDDRTAAPATELEQLTVKQEWATGCLKLCFWPLARFDNPAWALTDEEANVAAPEMQAFLQAIIDHYSPTVVVQALARLTNKYPEFADLVQALGLLYWMKWKQVRSIEVEMAERVDAAPPSPVKPTATSPEAGITLPDDSEAADRTCKYCQRIFPTVYDFALHRPCPERPAA